MGLDFRQRHDIILALQKKGGLIMAVTIKTGGIVPVSGQYRPNGSKTEYTFVQGKHIPPTKKVLPNSLW